jgi:hypothetical protein
MNRCDDVAALDIYSALLTWLVAAAAKSILAMAA